MLLHDYLFWSIYQAGTLPRYFLSSPSLTFASCRRRATTFSMSRRREICLDNSSYELENSFIANTLLLRQVFYNLQSKHKIILLQMQKYIIRQVRRIRRKASQNGFQLYCCSSIVGNCSTMGQLFKKWFQEN